MRTAGIAGVWLLALCLSEAFVIGTAPAKAQEFSAEIVARNTAGEIVGAPAILSAAGDKVRIETPELPGRYFIVDGSAPASYLVHPDSRIYMDSKQSSRLTRLFIRLDPDDDPCPRLKAMAKVAGLPDGNGEWRCEKAAPEGIAGRNAVKFTIVSPAGRNIVWIDTALRIPVRVETENGTGFELANIRERPQLAEQFAIPADYRKFDPHALFERLKHSDVWVQPPQ